jgi:hypothetical protein
MVGGISKRAIDNVIVVELDSICIVLAHGF